MLLEVPGYCFQRAGVFTFSAEEGAPAAAMPRETYQVDPALSDEEARDLVGVLYELALRSREITWSSYVFAQDVEMTFIVKVKEASLSGVSIDTTTVREYNTSYAAHLLGRVGLMDSDEWNNIYQALDYPYNASVGKDGMEQAFESYLHGVPGKRAIETNDQGKVVSADDNWKIDERTAALRVTPQALIGLEGELEHQYAEGEKADMEHQVQKLNVAAQQRGKKEEEIAGKDQQHVGCQDDPPAETG